MAKKILNGNTSTLLAFMAVILFIVAPVIWAVRQEGKVNKNTSDLTDFKADVREIKTDIKLILEKL